MPSTAPTQATGPELLMLTATQQFGTIQLSSGDVFINDFQAIVETPEQIAELRKLMATGRVPHLRIKEHEDIAAEVAAEENKLLGLKALLSKSRPRVGMTSSANVPTAGASQA